MLDHTRRRERAWCALTAGCLFLSPSAMAQAPRESQTQSAESGQAAQPGQIDLDRSRTYIKVGATGLGHEHGVAGRLKAGTVSLGAAGNAGKLVFDLKSLVADTPEARKQVGLKGETDKSTADQVTANMLGSGVLDVGKYPSAVYEIDSSRQLEADTRTGAAVYQLSGKLTLHGVTRPVKIQAKLETVGDRLRLRGSFDILQTDYGITPYSKLLGTIGVADRLTISGDVWLAADVQRAPDDSARGGNRQAR